MNQIFPLLLFFLLFNCLSPKLGDQKEDITEHELKEEMKTRKLYKLQSNKTYKIINRSPKYIYLIDLEEGLKAIDSTNRTFKKFVVLSQENDTLTINTPEEPGKELNLYACSILNEGVEAVMIKSSNFHITSIIDNNVIFLIHVNETEDQVINLGSLENSLLFSYWKYEYLENTIPNTIYPVNRTLLKKYDKDILTLSKNSVYVLVAEIYKFDSLFNFIDIFSSLAQPNKEIELEYDMLYLKDNSDTYKIKFHESNLTRILKLSKKTNDSVITLNGNTILDSKNFYYELNSEQIKNGIELKVTNDALIEILFKSDSDSEILDSYSIENHKLTKTYTIIKIPKNKCTYDFYLSSKNKNKLTLLELGFNHKISTKDYFYTWLTLNYRYNLENGIRIGQTSPYLYRSEVDKDEYQIFEIVLKKEQLDMKYI